MIRTFLSFSQVRSEKLKPRLVRDTEYLKQLFTFSLYLSPCVYIASSPCVYVGVSEKLKKSSSKPVLSRAQLFTNGW